MSDTVGYVLLIAAVVPLGLGWDMSRRGLSKVGAAADEAKKAAKEVSTAVAAAQEITANSGGADARALAETNAKIVSTTTSINEAVAGVKDALNGLTGTLAPARVFLAFALLLIVAALFALGLVDMSVGGQTPTPSN